MPKVKVRVDFIVEVPRSQKRDKALARMAMESEATRIVAEEIEGSDMDGSIGRMKGILSWTTDASMDEG